MSVTGPFIGLFINTCGCRRTAIIGGLLNSLGWVLSAYAVNVYYLFITFGLAAGKHCGFPFFFFWPRHTPYGILVSQPGVEPRPLALDAQSLDHWASREVPISGFPKLDFMCFC